MLRSMTGFGRCLLESDALVQQWEVRSVNGRHLDLKWRLPVCARSLEPRLEKTVRRHALRGRIDISLQLQFAPGAAPRQQFDTAQATAMLDSLTAFAASRGDICRVEYSALLHIPALWSEGGGEPDESLAQTLEQGLARTLEDWNEARAAEGRSLAADIDSRIRLMEGWTARIGERAPEIREERAAALRQRLGEALAAYGQELEETRLLQEVVIQADRLDVSEELTRLDAHLKRLRHLLQNGGDAGRRLDFTLQECFREINTCGTKLPDRQLSLLVADFKNELEKCREQVQNLE